MIVPARRLVGIAFLSVAGLETALCQTVDPSGGLLPKGQAARHLFTPDQRRAYLDRACADEPELRRQIEALLELEPPANEYFG